TEHHQTKISQNCLSLVIDNDIVRLDIAMDHAFAMCIVQRAPDITDAVGNISNRHQFPVKPILFEEFSDIYPLNILHSDVIKPIVFTKSIDVDNVWMVEPSN